MMRSGTPAGSQIADAEALDEDGPDHHAVSHGEDQVAGCRVREGEGQGDGDAAAQAAPGE